MRLEAILLLAIAAGAARGAGGFGALTGLAGGAADKLTQGVDKITSSLSNKDDCSRDVTEDFRRALYDFSTRLYKQVAQRASDHFTLSQFSAWLSLAAIAENTSGEEQKALLENLRLPAAECLRKKYYELALSLEPAGDDVTLARRRLLLVQPPAQLPANFSQRAGSLLQACQVDPAATAKDELKLSTAPAQASALLADSLDYSALWTSAFPEANIKRNQPFYDDNGKQIGTVDLMKIKKRVKLAHLPILNAKVLELPVGTDGRFRMLMLVNLGVLPIRHTVEIFQNTIIIDIFDKLLESAIPLEVSIPIFNLTSELKLRESLEAMGVSSVWKSSPAPAEYYQRVSVAVSPRGVSEGAPSSGSTLGSLLGAATGLAAAVGREFTANRPFMFGLVDKGTRTCLFTGAYSKPSSPS